MKTKTKTIRAVVGVIRKDLKGNSVLDVLTWKFIGLRDSQTLSWECGKIVWCGKFEHDNDAMVWGQADIDSFKSWFDRQPQVS